MSLRDAFGVNREYDPQKPLKGRPGCPPQMVLGVLFVLLLRKRRGSR